MTVLRAERTTLSMTSKCDLPNGIEGVRSALRGPRINCGGVGTAHATAGIESDSSKRLAEFTATEESAGVTGQVGSSSTRATVARHAASARVCLGSSSLAVSAAVAHSQASALHGARNSGGTGGLLPVQRSTSYRLDFSSQGPVVKGGVSRSVTCCGFRMMQEASHGCLLRATGAPLSGMKEPGVVSRHAAPSKRGGRCGAWTRGCVATRHSQQVGWPLRQVREQR